MPARPQTLQTRERIVAAATQAFRERGVAATGIDAVMARAGLTHGGFYAHFASKAELVQATLAPTPSGAARNQVFAQVEHLRGRAFIIGTIELYLSRWHRDHPGLGCPLPTLGAELPRLGAEFSGCMGPGVRALSLLIAEQLPLPHASARERAQALVSLLVGGVVCARALPDAQAEDWLAACRRQALALIDAPLAAA